ncbi:MAG: hypothetical protein K6E37_05645 [Bacteroidales bacterium]|nr:hypothetical protein [Bacteroidales bacterium]
MNKLFAAIGLTVLISGCIGITTEKVPAESITVSIQPASASGQYIAGSSSSVPYLENHWPSGGYAFYTFICQNGELYYSGVQNTKEKSISGSAVMGTVTVEVPVREGIDLTAPYSVLLADRSCEVDISDEGVFINADLKRGLSHISAYYVSSGINNELSPATAAFLTATECVWLTNLTGKPVSFKHKGFKASNKWYYVKASLRANYEKGVSVSPYTSSDGDEQSSDAQTVLAGERGFVLSQFIPNGKKMNNASIVLEIDGKDYSSPPFSSSAEYSCGELYFYALAWDGKSLTWLTD